MASQLQELPISGNNVAMTAVAFGILAMVYTVYKAVLAVGEYDGMGLPLAGEPDGKKKFSMKTRLRYYYDCAALYTEAYHKVSIKNKQMIDIEADSSSLVRQEGQNRLGTGLRWSRRSDHAGKLCRVGHDTT
jgi:hypothetical protein